MSRLGSPAGSGIWSKSPRRIQIYATECRFEEFSVLKEGNFSRLIRMNKVDLERNIWDRGI
jgi:hypothetical protein